MPSAALVSVTGIGEGGLIRDQLKSNNHLRNRVLAEYSAEEYARIEPDLEPFSLHFGEIIFIDEVDARTSARGDAY